MVRNDVIGFGRAVYGVGRFCVIVVGPVPFLYKKYINPMHEEVYLIDNSAPAGLLISCLECAKRTRGQFIV